MVLTGKNVYKRDLYITKKISTKCTGAKVRLEFSISRLTFAIIIELPT